MVLTLPAIPNLRRLALAALLLCAGLNAALAATPGEWKNGAYAYSADNTPLSIILEDFADSFGVTLYDSSLPEANITGKLRSGSPEAFLNRLALEYRFQWFVYNDTLYVSAQSAQVSRRLEISPDAAPDIKQALKGVGLLDPRFGWGELPDEGVVLVTGPPEYVAMIADFTKKSEKPKDDNKEMMSFPLKYASVADRTIKYRDQTLLVPGVATILNELLGQNSSPSASGMNSTQGGESEMDQMRSQSQSILNQLVGRGTGHGRAGDKNPLGSMAGKVSADVRNNALLVRDKPAYRSAYQSLVSMIDVPQKLIEIDALIVDIDRSEMARLSSSWAGQFGNVTGGSTLLSGPSTLFVTDFRRFFADIQALEGEGTASIIANPSIMTLENQPAVIDFSDTAFVRAIGERVADIQAVTAGTSLRVTPRAIGGKSSASSSVQLIVDVEDGKLNKNDDGDAEGTRNGAISTQALVQAKRSLVMGGFHTKESGDHERRIPILGSIPLIGKLFTTSQHETSQRERLFIITPHLVGDQVDPSRYIASENRDQLNNAMGEINRRHKYTDMKGMLESALRDLAENRQPSGMTAGGSGQTLSTLCRIPSGFSNDAQRHQWYGNRSVQIAVGVITNTSNVTRRFDEAACRSDRTLAVAAWPHSQLRPGESVEVYVAFEKNAVVRPGRTSLIASAR
ncbi:type III secretion system outer membrane ring subunit SctC [Serratia rhizosphaerae]|uniref:Type 3 secretion system secretin n=1 Tax=Serratia rhizosphaerae TaxID=2597702 RepID=A0ABX6GNM3_9GAMM|nr:type III secretion system outer membrane ring subunit SctC [Serratia rhizosphaerae]QHA87871.1 EscC/YscC/HrcC family type III secretion system outer membrane ring protein [Serratia rhizosphaerae]